MEEGPAITGSQLYRIAGVSGRWPEKNIRQIKKRTAPFGTVLFYKEEKKRSSIWDYLHK